MHQGDAVCDAMRPYFAAPGCAIFDYLAVVGSSVHRAKSCYPPGRAQSRRERASERGNQCGTSANGELSTSTRQDDRHALTNAPCRGLPANMQNRLDAPADAPPYSQPENLEMTFSHSVLTPLFARWALLVLKGLLISPSSRRFQEPTHLIGLSVVIANVCRCSRAHDSWWREVEGGRVSSACLRGKKSWNGLFQGISHPGRRSLRRGAGK